MNFFETKIESFMFNVSYSDITDSGLTKTLNIPNYFGGNSNIEYLLGIYGRVVTPFAGINGSVVMEIGDSTNANYIMAGVNLVLAAIDQELPTHKGNSSLVMCENYLKVLHHPNIPVMTFTSSKDALSGLTAGVVELVVVNLRRV